MDDHERDDEIINFVRNNKILFDKKSRSYRNNIFKNRLWDELAKSLNMEADTVMKRWRYLRDKYGKETKKMEELTRSGAEGIEMLEMWEHYESLSFLKDHLTRRTTSSNYTEEHASEEFLNESGEDRGEDVQEASKTETASAKRKRKDDLDAKMCSIMDAYIASESRHTQFAQHVAAKLSTLPVVIANQLEAQIMRLIYDAILENS